MKKLFLELLTSLMLGIGFILVLSPIALYWFIHGDSKRYIWIINGPYPFNSFGGGPFQMLMYTGLFIAGTLLCIAAGIAKLGARSRENR